MLIRRLYTSFLLILLCAAAPLPLQAKETQPSAAQQERNPAWAVPVPLEHADNFFKVDEGFFRSAQPDKEAMKSYEAFGIRTVINLRDNHSDDKEAKGTSLILLRVPTKTWKIGDKEVTETLALVRTVQKPVLLHCQHGADRTGLVVAMYRIVEQGWSKEAAIDELKNGGYGFHTVWGNIPEYIMAVDVQSIREQVDARVRASGKEAAPAQ